MDISPTDLLAELRRARQAWPFIGETGFVWGLPPGMLWAVGSRETNLRNVVGDGGHGHGVFQLDDRSHVIPPGFDDDVYTQAGTAGRMLCGLHLQYGPDWTRALNAYNSGQPNTAGTAGADYGPDVLGRQQWIEQHLRSNATMSVHNYPQSASSGELKFEFPVGSTSMITDRGWLRLSITTGTGTADVYLQNDTGGLPNGHWSLPLSKDQGVSRELPDGLTQFTLQWNLSPGAKLGIGLEDMAKIR